MGIGRFAFTPLLPLMVRDGALAQSAGAWLAASNYLGYLAGALTASRLGLSLPALMRLSLAGTVVATAAMGAVDGLAAWACLRFLAGVFSAWTLVATSAWVLKHLAQAGRTPHADICASLELFAKEVMPEFQNDPEHDAWKKGVMSGAIQLEEIDTEAFKDRYGKLAVNVAPTAKVAAG